MTTRRGFLKASLAGGLLVAAPRAALDLFATPMWSALSAPLLEVEPGETLITILHTNDTHSQIDPLPANDGQYSDKGGVARRATLVKRIRKENPNTLLVDAGDVFQGTPYFNFYKGEVEYKSMSLIGYDVVTLGNHDFDNGVDALAAAMKFATFEFVSCNYDVTGTPLERRVKPYVVRVIGGVRVGLFGMGVSPDNLITPENFKGVKYNDPVRSARDTVATLRGRERCALVVGMSHLGYYPEARAGGVGDLQVAEQVDGIDFIASGHTHTFMKQPVITKTPTGGNTMIFQVGRSGIYVGRVDMKMRDGKVTATAGRLLDLRDESLVRDVLDKALPEEDAASQVPAGTASRFIDMAPKAPPPTSAANPTRDESSKTVITEDDVRGLANGSVLRIAEGARLTPLAADIVSEKKIEIVRRVPRRGSKASKLIAVGADHGGFKMKEELKTLLQGLGHQVHDFGTNSEEPVDYPDLAYAVARSVAEGAADLGIVIDGAGVGSAMTANKVPGVRAAACYSVAVARNSREHNDANVLSLGSKTISSAEMREIVQAWLGIELTEDRHRKRVAKIQAIERQYSR